MEREQSLVEGKSQSIAATTGWQVKSITLRNRNVSIPKILTKFKK